MSQGSQPPGAGLTASTTSLLALLQSFVTTLHPSNSDAPPTTPPQTSAPDPVDLLHTSATLLKAQTTKLSLLLINDPFTPSAAQTMVSEIAAKSAPAILTAAQTCVGDAIGKTMRDEVRSRARRIFVELVHLVKEVQTKAAQKTASSSTSSKKAKADTASAANRDSLASTGVVWSACDAAVALRDLGVHGLLLQRASDGRSTLEDAALELREWRDDADDEGFESDEESSGNYHDAFDSQVFESAAEDGGASLEKMLGAAHRLPSGRADLRELLEEALRRMRLTGTLYAAVGKRRFGKLKGDAVTKNNLARADAAVFSLKRIPHLADEMAGRFYELDVDGARTALQSIRKEGGAVCDALLSSWEGEQDEFSAWCEKWRQAMDAPPSPAAGSS